MIEKLKKMFTEHPNSVGETYFRHMFWAILYSLSLIVAGIACAVHSVFPFLFTKTASSIAEWILNTNERRRSDYDE
jgi:thiosulfate reductase cytochrome b subunit